MTKKIYAIAIIALTLGSVTTYAQKPIQNPGRLEATCSVREHPVQAEGGEAVMADRPCQPKADLFDGIELTADQKAKIGKLERKDRQERDKQAAKARKERGKKMEKRHKEMAKILTPAQYERYKTNAKAMKEKCHNGKHGKGLCGKNGDGKHRKHAKCRKPGSKESRGGCCGQSCGKQAEKKQG